VEVVFKGKGLVGPIQAMAAQTVPEIGGKGVILLHIGASCLKKSAIFSEGFIFKENCRELAHQISVL
jgi:hypothetical protein